MTVFFICGPEPHSQLPSLARVRRGNQRLGLLRPVLMRTSVFQVLVVLTQGTGEGSDKGSAVAFMLIHPGSCFVELGVRRPPQEPTHTERSQNRQNDGHSESQGDPHQLEKE